MGAGARLADYPVFTRKLNTDVSYLACVRLLLSDPKAFYPQQHPGLYASIQATFAGPNWIVDVVDGDYYSVHTVAQTNYLFDNDVATQVSSDTHYSLVGGHNELGNLAQIFDGNLNYDLIVIKAPITA